MALALHQGHARSRQHMVGRPVGVALVDPPHPRQGLQEVPVQVLTVLWTTCCHLPTWPTC
jgi:hypothetical protein